MRSEVEFTPETPSAPPSCPFCFELVSGQARRNCARCKVAYHSDCWIANGRRCAVYGCEKVERPPAVPELPSREFVGSRSGSSRVSWGVIGFGLLALAQLMRQSGPSTPPSRPVSVRSYVDLESTRQRIPQSQLSFEESQRFAPFGNSGPTGRDYLQEANRLNAENRERMEALLRPALASDVAEKSWPPGYRPLHGGRYHPRTIPGFRTAGAGR